MSYVEYRTDGKIAYISLNRPERHNAMNDDDVEEFVAAMQHFDGDGDAFVAILSGNGPSFCSGADVQARLLTSVGAGVVGHYRPSGEDAFYKTVNWKPVIAAVHGYALGKGMALALCCDLVVAGEDARFQLTEIVRGVPANAYFGLLARGAIDAFATEVALTGRFWSAEEGFRHGLVNRIAPRGTHLEVARELAEEILTMPPLATRSVVRVRRAQLDQLAAGMRVIGTPYRWDQSEDFRESVDAYLEKRTPIYKGK